MIQNVSMKPGKKCLIKFSTSIRYTQVIKAEKKHRYTTYYGSMAEQIWKDKKII